MAECIPKDGERQPRPQRKGHTGHADDGDAGASIVEHEGALIASVMHSLEGDYAAVVEDVRQRLATVAEWVDQSGGIVGHIKACVTESPTVTMLSTTGDEVSTLPVKSTSHTVEAVTIVFNIEKEALIEKMSTLFD